MMSTSRESVRFVFATLVIVENEFTSFSQCKRPCIVYSLYRCDLKLTIAYILGFTYNEQETPLLDNVIWLAN